MHCMTQYLVTLKFIHDQDMAQDKQVDLDREAESEKDRVVRAN